MNKAATSVIFLLGGIALGHFATRRYFPHPDVARNIVVDLDQTNQKPWEVCVSKANGDTITWKLTNGTGALDVVILPSGTAPLPYNRTCGGNQCDSGAMVSGAKVGSNGVDVKIGGQTQPGMNGRIIIQK